MKQEQFIRRHEAAWDELGRLLSRLEVGHPTPELGTLPERYRALCQQLALAQHRHYAGVLVDRLNGLALRAHDQLYRRPPIPARRVVDLLVQEFPRAVRNTWALHGLAAILFYGSFVLAMLLVSVDPARIHLVLDAGTVAQMEEMYDPASDHFLKQRGADSDLYMFGFYILNNVGIALRTFGMGVVGGVGSAFTLLYNGLVIGGVAGHLTAIGYGVYFWPFVVGHSSFELNAIVVAGAAGLKLGFALLAPGRLSRKHSLQRASQDALVLVAGCAFMLLIAAFIEAFWSSSSLVPIPIKYAVGAVLWILVFAWLGLGGRGGS